MRLTGEVVLAKQRLLLVRNLAIALVNGLFTLIILLIAPLGLLAVIVNTFLVIVASFFVGMVGDGVIRWLLPGSDPTRLSGGRGEITYFNSERSIERRD